MKVTITGAGVAGLCIAAELTTRGFDVSLHDHHPAPGPHACSWWAGGMLAPFVEVESAEEPVLRLGKPAIDWWQGAGATVTRSGTLVVAPPRDGADLMRFARRTKGHRSVSPGNIEPDLSSFGSGLFYEDEAHLAPRQALLALANGLNAKGIPIQAEPDASADIHIRACGLSDQENLPDLRGVKGEMLLIRCPEVTLNRPVRLLHPRIPLYVVPRGDGVFMLGATMVETADKTRITARSMVELLNAAYALNPAFAEAEILEIGVDARPAFADNLPRLRRFGKTIYANGLYRHGYLLAPALARMVADHLETGSIPEFMDEHHP